MTSVMKSMSGKKIDVKMFYSISFFLVIPAAKKCIARETEQTHHILEYSTKYEIPQET